MPLIMALCVVMGIFIGTFYANHFSGNRLSIINSSSNKFCISLTTSMLTRST